MLKFSAPAKNGGTMVGLSLEAGNIEDLKKDKHVLKFMKRYRHNYDIEMLPNLAELAYTFYLEGYENGLKQHPVEEPNA